MDDRRTRRLAQVALALFTLVGALFGEAPAPVVIGCTALVLLAAALLPRGGLALLGGALVAGGGVTGLCSGSSGNVGWFAICVLAGWCALRGGPGPAAVFTALATVGFTLQATVVAADPGWFTWVAGTVFTVVVCLMSRRQRVLLEQLHEAQAGLTERVRAQERNRVAGELHDVIGHSLTVSLLHVSSARLALEDDPATAAEALGQAEQLGRQSLAEVRHAVGLLHDGAGSRSPLPGAAELPALVDGFRRAGAKVAYDVVGDPARLPATTALTLYRILQESLTNAVRHGAGAGAAVHLQVDERTAELTVESAGAPAADGSGLGLRSMRERAESVGGRLVAGPAGAGWRVHAVLPS